MHTCFHPDLSPGVLELIEEEALHVVRVLRMREGGAVRLMDGIGGVATGELVHVGKRHASVHVELVSRSEERPSGLSLIVAPTKHTDRFEWLVEKATELGVKEIIPVWTRRSERRTDKHARWSKVVVAATKQCQRLWMPLLHEACPLEEVFERQPQLKAVPGAVAHCDDMLSRVPVRVGWSDWQSNHENAWLAVGPEGDFSAEEVAWLHASGATPVHLGSLRLRTETAGMAAVAQFTTNH
jgi:16S rRNA (uracil1498-N3)-methyltransferase